MNSIGSPIPSTTSDKRPICAIAAAVLLVSACLAASCAPSASGPDDFSKTRSENLSGRKQVTYNSAPPGSASGEAAQPDNYFGEDWASPQFIGARPQAQGQQGSPKGGAAAPRGGSDGERDITWSLVLGTFTEGDHADAAHRMIANLQQIAPQVQGCRVHTTARGSMVVYGHFTDREDPKASAEQERLKKITYNGHPVFKRVLLTKIDLRLTRAQLHPHDLLSARRQFPKVNPLYTLDIAIWVASDAPGTGQPQSKGASTAAKDSYSLPYSEARKRAEAYAQQLRSQGHQAYFYHDPEMKQSMVTIGLFNSSAINHLTGFLSDEVRDLLKQFPARLFNGEKLELRGSSSSPGSTKAYQKPILVLVPAM